MRTAQIIRALSVATVVAVWGAVVAGAGKADGVVAAGAVQAGELGRAGRDEQRGDHHERGGQQNNGETRQLLSPLTT